MTKRNFSELLERIEGKHARCLYSTFNLVHYHLELGVSFQQHQDLLRHQNEAALVLEHDFGF